MSILSTLGKVVGGILLTLGIMFLVFAIVFSNVTTHDNLRPVFSDVLTKQINLNETQMEQARLLLIKQCQLTGKETIVIPAGAYNLSVTCNQLQNNTAKQLLAGWSNAIFDSIYYKNYSCEFVDCVSNAINNRQPQDALVIVSAKGNKFFNDMLLYSIIMLVAGIVLIIVSIRRIFSILKSIGITMIIAGIPFFVLLWLRSAIPSTSQTEIMNSINNIFTMLGNMFLIVFIIGIILAVVGIVGRHFYEKDKENGKGHEHSKKKK